MRTLVGVVMLVSITGPALAQMRPTAGAGDPRLQSILYDPSQVVELAVTSGYQLMVSFAEGERIETIAVGDGTAWQVTADKRGANLFIKCVQGGDTNLTVVTDARIYSFKLTRSIGLGATMPYIVRFTYPEAPASSVVMPIDQSRYRYRLSGERSIRPSIITTDGGNTTIEWAKSQALPAIFRVDDDGEESLVNGKMRDDHFIVEGTPAKLVFRLDQMMATATRIRLRNAHQ